MKFRSSKENALGTSNSVSMIIIIILFFTVLWCTMYRVRVDVLCNWYSKVFVVIRWNGALSRTLYVQSGVRQGGCISPTIFNMIIFIHHKW